MNRVKSNEKGVTILALGVMIIILLILAGAATSQMDEMDGVITQAQETKELVESQDKINQSEEKDLNNKAISYIMN